MMPYKKTKLDYHMGVIRFRCLHFSPLWRSIGTILFQISLKIDDTIMMLKQQGCPSLKKEEERLDYVMPPQEGGVETRWGLITS